MKLALLSVFLALPILAQTSQPVRFVNADPSGACSNGTAMRYNFVNGRFWGCQSLVWTIVSGGSAGGTVTVQGSGNLANNAIMTGAGTQVSKTPQVLATLDSSGNISTPGTISTTGTGPSYTTQPPMLVSALPTCSSPMSGTRASVTDATATTFFSVVVGGGGNTVPVFCDGSGNWRVG